MLGRRERGEVWRRIGWVSHWWCLVVSDGQVDMSEVDRDYGKTAC